VVVRPHRAVPLNAIADPLVLAGEVIAFELALAETRSSRIRFFMFECLIVAYLYTLLDTQLFPINLTSLSVRLITNLCEINHRGF
jgi:hypothetical protein